MPTKKIYQKRTFLNTDKTTSAFIIANVENDEVKYKSGQTDKYTSANLDFNDCNRKVSIDFYFDHKKKYAKEKLKKIQLLRRIVNEFADALEAQINEVLVQK